MNALVLALMVAGAGIRPFPSMRETSIRAQQGSAPSVTIAAMPYARTVTCSDYTLTGTSTGSGAVSWSASPSGASGACTGTTSWSCVVDVNPSSAGQGVETITVTRGGATDTETIGFYVDGEHSCWLSQNINGTYNSGMTNADAVATWENLGSSALDVTQGTGSAQPSYRTAVVGGQPVVRCDGGDRVAAATAADWTFLYDGTDWTVEGVENQTSGANGTVTATSSANGTHGFSTLNVGGNFYLQMFNAALATNFSFFKSGYINGVFNLASVTLDDDGGAGNDAAIYVNSLAAATAARGSTYSVSVASPLALCAYSAGGTPLTGDVFRVLIYQSALDSTQRGINKAVDEWALGGTLPVTP